MPRSSPRLRAAVTAAGAAGTLVAALAFPAAAGASTQHGRAALNLHTTHTHRVKAPATTHPGIVRLRDTGRAPVMVVEAKHAHAGRAGVAHGLNSESTKPLLEKYRLITLVDPHSGSYVHLGRGRYFLADLDTGRFHASKIATMLVTGTRRDATLPTSYVTVFTSHRRLLVPRDLPRNGYLHLENHSSVLMELLLFPVRAKTSDATLRRLVAHPSFEKAFEIARPSLSDFTPLLITGPHGSSWPRMHRSAGRYIALAIAATNGDVRLHRGDLRIVDLG